MIGTILEKARIHDFLIYKIYIHIKLLLAQIACFLRANEYGHRALRDKRNPLFTTVGTILP